MRRALLAAAPLGAALLLLRACREEEEPPPPLPRPVPVRWVGTQPPGWTLRFEVPAAWADQQTVLANGREFHFNGPVDDGYHPELAIGWTATETDPQAWSRRKVDAFAASPFEQVFESGPCTVAGMAGQYCAYGYERRLPGGERQPMRGLAFFFGGHGHIGFVRGTATLRGFLHTYRDLFREAAARVRYEPSR